MDAEGGVELHSLLVIQGHSGPIVFENVEGEHQMKGSPSVLQIHPGELRNFSHSVVHGVAVDEQLGGSLCRTVVAEDEGSHGPLRPGPSGRPL